MTDSCGKCGCHSFALLYGMFCIYISYHTCDIELSVESQHKYLHCTASPTWDNYAEERVSGYSVIS